jgi:hypothetical protein
LRDEECYCFATHQSNSGFVPFELWLTLSKLFTVLQLFLSSPKPVLKFSATRTLATLKILEQWTSTVRTRLFRRYPLHVVACDACPGFSLSGNEPRSAWESKAAGSATTGTAVA